MALPLAGSSKEYTICAERKEGQSVGKFLRRKHLFLKKLPFNEFFNQYYLPTLIKYKRQRFLCIILSRTHIAKQRQQSLIEGEVWSMRDFAERLTLKYNLKCQSEHFLCGATVSLERVDVEFLNRSTRTGEVNNRMEFHTHFNDGKIQDSSVVMSHMDTLIDFLFKEEVMNRGSSIVSMTDGCAGQYRSGTAYYFLAYLCFRHKISIGRAISAPGHVRGSLTP